MVVLPASMGPLPEKDVANFNLGYYLSDDETALLDYSVKWDEEKVEFMWPVKLPRKYKTPYTEDSIKDLSQKSFSSETVKKLRWVVHMYTQWRTQWNRNSDLPTITCNLLKLVNVDKKSIL